MASPPNRRNNKNTPTANKNYTSLDYGNDHAKISFGHLHKQGDCTSDILLQASDGRHSITLDKNGPRKGCTQITAPGRISIEAGEDLTEPEDTIFIHTWNGNIDIIATKGKLRLQGSDIEIIALGEDGSKGNVTIYGEENVNIESKKVQISAKSLYRLASAGKAELVANNCMNIYSAMIRGVTDAVTNQDSKVGGRKIRKRNNQLG